MAMFGSVWSSSELNQSFSRSRSVCNGHRQDTWPVPIRAVSSGFSFAGLAGLPRGLLSTSKISSNTFKSCSIEMAFHSYSSAFAMPSSTYSTSASRAWPCPLKTC